MERAEIIRAWAILVVVLMAMAVSVGGSMYAFGLIVPPMEAQFGWSRTQISASLSFVAVGSLAAPLLGRLMDRYGARPILVFSLTLAGGELLSAPVDERAVALVRAQLYSVLCVCWRDHLADRSSHCHLVRRSPRVDDGNRHLRAQCWWVGVPAHYRCDSY